MRALDQKIARALALSVPELRIPDLPDIDTTGVVPLDARRRFTAPVWLAVAATLVLAAFIGVRIIGGNVTYPTLADEIIAHLDHEPYALRVTDEPVDARRLAKVVPANVATMNHDAGLITYAQTCVINGRKIPHLVIQGEQGPVTILLLPDEAVESFRKTIKKVELASERQQQDMLFAYAKTLGLVEKTAGAVQPVAENISQYLRVMGIDPSGGAQADCRTIAAAASS
jgi:hypothetical protein